jgi:hypothetical protein
MGEQIRLLSHTQARSPKATTVVEAAPKEPINPIRRPTKKMKRNIHSKSWTLQCGNTNNGGAVIWATIGGDILFSTIPSTNSGSSQIISDDTLRSHVNLKLGTDGTLMAKEIKVTLTGWPDYVFDK